ncbi:MAG: hypothetical protein AB7H43_01385 [Acidimicrobiia bacterium]
MCMQCVAQSTPMIGVGLTVLRRRALLARFRALIARRPRDASGGDLGHVGSS